VLYSPHHISLWDPSHSWCGCVLWRGSLPLWFCPENSPSPMSSFDKSHSPPSRLPLPAPTKPHHFSTLKITHFDALKLLSVLEQSKFLISLLLQFKDNLNGPLFPTLAQWNSFQFPEIGHHEKYTRYVASYEILTVVSPGQCHISEPHCKIDRKILEVMIQELFDPEKRDELCPSDESSILSSEVKRLFPKWLQSKWSL